MSCATLPSALGHFHRGGSLPSGVPVPQAVPAFTCTGTGGRIAVSWTTVSAPQYAQELTGTGWARTGATYRKPHAPRTIELLTVRHALVAVYRPS